MKTRYLAIIIAIMMFLVGCSTENALEVEEADVENTGVVLEGEEKLEETPALEEEAIEEEEVLHLAPDFTLLNLNDEEVSLSDYRGKYVLINFWATWCGFCDMEMPDLQKLDDENDDWVVLAVDVLEDKSIVEDYINQGGYDFEVVLDTEGEVASTYLVCGFPTSYFVDPEGYLIWYYPGMMTYDQMNDIVDSLK
jgi:thiol-disulfide isomerase/thioredoxin